MSLKKSTTTNINQYLEDELRTTEARNFQVEILRDADLLERVFLEKMNKKVSETQIDDVQTVLEHIPNIAPVEECEVATVPQKETENIDKQEVVKAEEKQTNLKEEEK